MAEHYADSVLTENFFRNYARELLHRADTAGLLDHRATSGSVKEFLCRAILSQTLPAACTLVTGQSFDGKGVMSRQCDVIVFDDRVPKLEVATNIGMYSIEGVIASVEVKSQLNKGAIYESLDNSLSVLELNPMHCGKLQLNTVDGARTPETLKEQRQAFFQLSAATYIFSFDSCRKETAANHVEEWYRSHDDPTHKAVNAAKLPSCIVGKDWIGLLNDGYIAIGDGTKNVMVFLNLEGPLVLFLSHLLHKVSLRIRAQIGTTDSYFTFNHLLPTSRLLEELVKSGDPIFKTLG